MKYASGQKYGALTLIEKYSQSKPGKPEWVCRCDCGKEVIRRADRFNFPNPSCGCKHPMKTNGLAWSKKRWTGYKEINGSYFNELKRRGIQRGFSFEVTIEQLWDLFLEQNRLCALTGRPLKFKHSRRYGETEQTASLDRKDSLKGYTLDNVWWIHKQINLMKNDVHHERFIDVCQKVINFQRRTEPLPEFIYKEPYRWKTWSGCGEISGFYFAQIRASAKHRNIYFDLTPEQIWDICLKQKCRCALTGEFLTFKTSQRRKIGIQTASLDRIDSSGGYTVNNVWFVHVDVNTIKHKFSTEEFMGMCREVVDYGVSTSIVPLMVA